jgi:aminomethyltransferase
MLKHTPLHDRHLQLGAKMVPFAGWEMPVSYPAGIIAEHNAVRTSVGLFDIGHMGVIKVEGADALSFIQRLATNDASKLKVNFSQYSLLCNENGGTVDDILVYHLPMSYLIIGNACNYDKVLSWLNSHANKFKSLSVSSYENYCMLAIQGPKAIALVGHLLHSSFSELSRSELLWWRDIIVSRTGYTGEDGVEMIVHKQEITALWDKFIGLNIQPCGLGARDTLRLEAGLPLYGHEYDEKTTPLEAGYSWAVKFEKGDFVGRSALLKEKENGRKKTLLGLEIDSRQIPREGAVVLDNKGKQIGAVTSGTFSPTFKKPLALAYLKGEGTGQEVKVDIRGNLIPAKIVAKNFYKR